MLAATALDAPQKSLDQRLARQVQLMRIHEVCKRCGLSRSSIYAAMRAKEFPQLRMSA
jgi:predicted DNA-binding transcriptional regulator AlpA